MKKWPGYLWEGGREKRERERERERESEREREREERERERERERSPDLPLLHVPRRSSIIREVSRAI